VLSWFPLDCLVVGVDWLEVVAAAAAEGLGFARMSKISRGFRIVRMIRLLRLARMKEVLGLLMERLDNECLVIFLDVAKLILLMMASGHFLACIWYAIGKADDTDRNWLSHYHFRDQPVEYRYIMSARWAVSQFAGGMDEITPESLGEHVFAFFCADSYFLVWCCVSQYFDILDDAAVPPRQPERAEPHDFATVPHTKWYLEELGLACA
jgi:hypothetical protein